MKGHFDFRITYICACCGGFSEISLLEIECFDNGTTLTCDKCGGQTVFGLFATSEYSRIIQAAAQHRLAPDGAVQSQSTSSDDTCLADKA